MNHRRFFVGRAIVTSIIFGILGLVGLFFAFNSYVPKEKVEVGEGLSQAFKAVTFTISGEPITLIDGVAKLPIAPESASVHTVRYFGNEVHHDIDGDGDLDTVFLVTDDSGGSGTFFYVVGAIKQPDGYTGSQAMFLGDRIAPQTTEKGEGTLVIVNYADRAPGEPMSTQPSVGKSMWLKFDPERMDFGEVVQNFEGESDGTLAEKRDLIRASSPAINATVSNPITVSGEARGYWFFEGSFPLVVVDWDGLIIGQGHATAASEWMTEDFVPFTGTVNYELPEDTPYKRGAIILRKDNPSGLPEFDDALEIPVLFE